MLCAYHLKHGRVVQHVHHEYVSGGLISEGATLAVHFDSLLEKVFGSHLMLLQQFVKDGEDSTADLPLKGQTCLGTAQLTI